MTTLTYAARDSATMLGRSLRPPEVAVSMGV